MIFNRLQYSYIHSWLSNQKLSIILNSIHSQHLLIQDACHMHFLNTAVPYHSRSCIIIYTIYLNYQQFPMNHALVFRPNFTVHT